MLLHALSFTELPEGLMWPQVQQDVTHKSRIPGEKSSSTDETYGAWFSASPESLFVICSWLGPSHGLVWCLLLCTS